MLINKRIENVINPKTLTDYSQRNDVVYENLEDYKPKKERKVLIVFDDMEVNSKLKPIVTKLLMRRRKPNISVFYITA